MKRNIINPFIECIIFKKKKKKKLKNTEKKKENLTLIHNKKNFSIYV